jgi:putative methionine-R-sulfoxide reductase with GAF domain
MPPPPRNYTDLLVTLRAEGDRHERMQSFVDALWPELSRKGISWLGFYLVAHDPTRGDEMLLGPRRDKPACSPIGMHGACGRCYLSRRPLVVTDVANLGQGYIACDPRDRSEVVVPLLNADGSCWGVLDVDSFDLGAFAETDVEGLQAVLVAAGLTMPHDWRNPPRVEVV